jgi:hypothetical protein
MAPPVPHLAPCHCPNNALLDFATRAGNLTVERAEELASLAPHLTGGQQGAEALARLMSIANYLIGRKAQ